VFQFIIAMITNNKPLVDASWGLASKGDPAWNDNAVHVEIDPAE